MVNLVNPRLPLAPHSQHARKAPGRENKVSSQAAMTEERPQQSVLLSVSSTDAPNVSVLPFENHKDKMTQSLEAILFFTISLWAGKI